ncbi:MAG: hypothetical protein WBM90_06675 [Acidimicrobiia bacterium]
MRWRIGLVALVMAVVACGGSSSSDGTSTPGAASPPPSSGEPVAEGSFETVQAMQKAVEAAFYLCTAPIKIYDPPILEGALAQADCSSVVSLLIFPPDGVANGAADLLASGTSVLILGNNWIIGCSTDEAACERIHGGTGGELVVNTP